MTPFFLHFAGIVQKLLILAIISFEYNLIKHLKFNQLISQDFKIFIHML
jgi:hypothetical protein